MAFALYRADIGMAAPQGKAAATRRKIDPGQLGQKAESPDIGRRRATTVKEYAFRAGRAAAGDQGHVGL